MFKGELDLGVRIRIGKSFPGRGGSESSGGRLLGLGDLRLDGLGPAFNAELLVIDEKLVGFESRRRKEQKSEEKGQERELRHCFALLLASFKRMCVSFIQSLRLDGLSEGRALLEFT